MEDVPVKIVERYKPPPAVYHLPQATLNRLSQFREGFYTDHPDYQYDCQLERAVLSQAQRWRHLRRQQREERASRQERRKEERQRALEAKQKEMLGAVDYPSADDLSSDEDEKGQKKHEPEQREEEQQQQPPPPITAESRDSSHEPKSISVCNFHNILQPTILSTTPVVSPQTLHKRNSSLNYADFEYNMNSTPFDNIELKTINDLDILAQVLHQTQLEKRIDQQQQEEQQQQAQQQQEPPHEDHSKEVQSGNEVPAPVELAVTTLAETKATLDSVNFHVHCDDNEDTGEPSHIPATALYPTPMYSASAQQPLHKPEHFQVYHMQGYSHQPLYSPQQHPYQQFSNYQVNGFGTPNHLKAPPAPSSVLALSQSEDEVATKSRSVPDILRELKTELQQAEKRRTRLHSHNAEQQPTVDLAVDRNSFRELAGPAQKLAQRISTMGFPLERVAKVVNLCGIDDKKIIEHLIPLGELLDLGFDESKISAALLKFNNNKDKALDYLIN
ncbi:probable basic-leucine zipper transcription factor R [Drosophila mauritiana]|uniref:Probable basic-leucine zipper transcription factor R n=1 Tax=Drosophila mauritiana TaxID=7226 RepID=A0A6P8KJ58_DROMA|nr:probable basic-leucine zipper transcription factor R [Drosophila mauritiana]